MQDRFFGSRWVQLTLISIFAIPLLIHTYNVHFSRWIADDYDYASVLEREGLAGSVAYWYREWTGNYSSSLLQGMVMLPGPEFLGPMLSVMLVAWWIGAVWLVYEVSLLLKLQRPCFVGVLMGSALLLAVIDGLPNQFDTIYWAAGGIAHVMPLILLIYYLAMLLYTVRHTPSGRISPVATVASPVIMFTAAGFSPATTAHQLVVLLLILAAYRFLAPMKQRRTALPILITGLVAVIIAMALIFNAPGTSIRQAHFAAPPGFFEFVLTTTGYSAGFVFLALAVFMPFTLLLVILLSGIVVYYLHPGYSIDIQGYSLLLLGLASATGFLLIMTGYSTGVYAMSTILPSRANTTPVTMLVIIAAAWGAIMGLSLKQTSLFAGLGRALLVVLALLIALGPVQMTLRALHYTPRMQTYAQEWSVMHEQLLRAQAAGEKQVIVTPFSFDLGAYVVDNPLGEDPGAPANRFLSRYYGIERIIARPNDF